MAHNIVVNSANFSLGIELQASSLTWAVALQLSSTVPDMVISIMGSTITVHAV